MNRNYFFTGVLSAVLLLAVGCSKSKDDKEPSDNYSVPTTYNFGNVDLTESVTRLGMITEMQDVMKTATTGVLDGQKLKDMLANANAPFATAAYNTSGIQLKNQCAPLFQTDFNEFVDKLAEASQSGQPASKGVAGVGASSANPNSLFALSATGINYAQVFNKGIMGALISYQIMNTYMPAAAAGSLDNNTVMDGKGTALEHAWDLAFGYWGVPLDFPANKTGAKLWGSYSTQVDAGFHANQILMDAFLKGRAAISHKDSKTVTEQANLIKETFERLTGAAALQEVKEVKEALNDNIQRNSRLSECYGFIYSLKYLPGRTITDAQIDAILALFPANFYDLTLEQVDQIRDAVAAQYDFEDVKDVL